MAYFSARPTVYHTPQMQEAYLRTLLNGNYVNAHRRASKQVAGMVAEEAQRLRGLEEAGSEACQFRTGH